MNQRCHSDPQRSAWHPTVTAVLGAALLLLGCSASATTPTAAAAPAVSRSAVAGTPAGATPSPGGSAVAGLSGGPSQSPSPAPLPSLGELTLLWQKGGRVTSSPSTWWPAIDPRTGNVWVSAAYEDRFWLFSPDGAFLEAWGTSGSDPGQITLLDNAVHPNPLGTIAFRPDGGFFVGDVGNDRIEAFDANRRFVRAWGSFGSNDGQFSQIVGLATDGKTVYVIDGDRRDIQAFDANGAFLRAFGGDDPLPGFAALDASGNLYLSYGVGSPPAGIVKYDPAGDEIGRFVLPVAGGAGQGVAVDAQGDIFTSVTDTRYADPGLGTYELAPDGHVLRAWSTSGESLALSPTGDTIYFAREASDGTGWPYIRAYAIPKG